MIATSRDAGRRVRLAEVGADLVLDPGDPDWVDEAREATGGKGVDLTIDQVSGSLANQTMQAAAVLGRIVNVGRLGGFTAEFDFDLHALKRIDYIGVTFRTRSVEEVRAINAAMRADIWEAVEDGTLSLPIDRSFPLEQAAEAQGSHARQRTLRQDHPHRLNWPSGGRRFRAGPAGNEAVVLNPPVRGEVEDGLANIDPALQIDRCSDHLVALGLGLGHDLSRRRDDAAPTHVVNALLHAGLGRGHHPGAVLIGAGLHGRGGCGT